MNCKVDGIQSPIDIKLTKSELKLGMHEFKKKLTINYRNAHDFFTLKWKHNLGFQIDLIKSSKKLRNEVYNKLNIDSNLTNIGQSVNFEYDGGLVLTYKLVRV